MLANILANAAEVYRTSKLDNSVLLSVAIIFAFIFVVCFIFAIYDSGRSKGDKTAKKKKEKDEDK